MVRYVVYSRIHQVWDLLCWMITESSVLNSLSDDGGCFLEIKFHHLEVLIITTLKVNCTKSLTLLFY